MKLTEKQKQAICSVYERAMAMKNKYGVKPLLITFEIDHYQMFDIRVFEDCGRLTRLAADSTSVYDEEKCFQVIAELEDYCETFLNNKKAANKARIEALEKELATLKSQEE